MHPALEPASSRRPRGSGAPPAPAVRRPGHRLVAEAFERLPEALMICDRRGRVVATTRRLRDLVGHGHGTDGLAATCCSLLGCRRAGGPLDGRCLTAEALAAGMPLPELRLDAGTVPVAAAVTPLEGDGVLFRLHPARGAGTLRIHALGPLRVEGPDGPIGGDWLSQRPGDLLRLLICRRGHAAPADAIAEAIWPQAGPAAATSVRHFVHALRERLEPDRPRHAEPSFVVCRRGAYALDPELVRIDADDFEREAGAGLAALAAGEHGAAAQRLGRAAALYADDLLVDEPYADWALTERERLRSLAADVLRALARLHAGDPHAAGPHLDRLAELEPFDSDVQREHLGVLLRLGRRSRAARQYESFRVRLLREFGERPDFELSGLA
jgi:DNA-binding SARP family transcriptional activator